MRVLLKEINRTQCGFEYNLESFGLFDNVMSFSKIDKSSQIYEMIKEIEKKMNWLRYNGQSIQQESYWLFNLGYISILNECLKIDENHIILLCFKSIPDLSSFEIMRNGLNEELFMYICKEFKEYEQNYKSLFEDVKESLKELYSSNDEKNDYCWFEDKEKNKIKRVFERYFDENKFNDDFFNMYMINNNSELSTNFYRNLSDVFNFCNKDLNIFMKEALKNGILDLSEIPYLYGLVLEIPKVSEIKITEIDDNVSLNTRITEIDDNISLNTKIFEDSDININIARIGSESVWDFTDCEDEGRWSFRQKIVNQKYEEIPIKIEED